MSEIGDLRPSQLIFTFGVGALLDLPNMSVMVMGLDDWDTRYCVEITEDRLLAALKHRLGEQVNQLYLPPVTYDDTVSDGAASPGVPVAPFPRWLRCPICDTLATIDSGVFNLFEDRYRPDRTRYVHGSCRNSENPPTALPVRFLLACREGHLSDFPWVEYVHNGRVPCKPSRLTMREYGAAGDASDIIIKCIECGVERRMGDAFDRDRVHFQCRSHHPHLRRTDAEQCEEEARPILLGSSNSWFPLYMSALSIPPRATDRLDVLVHENWTALKDIPTLEVAKYILAPSRMPVLSDFNADQVWQAIQRKKDGDQQQDGEPDLKLAEWDVLSQPGTAFETSDFKLSKVAPPQGFEEFFEETVRLDRIREVRALLGFTRIESKGDFADAAYVDDGRETPLSRNNTTWLPASEVRGEGIFLRLKEEKVQAWENEPAVKQLENEFFIAHRAWRQMRKMEPYTANFPGIRFILIHSLIHALLRQISLECGYTVSSLRERIYSQAPGGEGKPMSGGLIYTAASDSEGTLGGLVSLGDPVSMGRHLQQALEAMRVCASDPLCAEHAPLGDGRGIHGACCHACLFAPETSCEKGNRYLDRNVLVNTFSGKRIDLFGLD